MDIGFMNSESVDPARDAISIGRIDYTRKKNESIFLTPLARFHALVHANFIGNRTSTGSDTRTDDRALWSAEQTTNDSSADSRATDDFSPRVMTMIMRPLRRHGAIMTRLVVLRECR